MLIFQSDVSSETREVSQLEMETWCNENSIASCIETSAKNASNVHDAFRIAVQHWLKTENRADRNDCTYNDTVDLSKKQNENRSSCCTGSDEQ